jgi:thiol-disulfide isomerase/thioredoxin
MKIKLALVVSIIAAAALVAACSRPEPESPYASETSRSSAPAASASSGVEVVEAAASNQPWYAAELEKLGFFVFPSPEPIPAFTVKTLAGADTGVSALAGKVVLLNFWATWCPPCRTEMPSIQILHEKLKGSAFEVMAISVAEKPGTVTDFLKSNPYTFPMYLDETGSASAPFASRGIPTTFLLDKQGRAIAAIVGARSYDGPELVALFKSLAERL